MVFGHHGGGFGGGFGHHHHFRGGGFGHRHHHGGGGFGLGVGLLGAGLLAGAAVGSSSNRSARREEQRARLAERRRARFPPGPWTCPICTCYNEVYLDRCEACANLRRVPQQQPQVVYIQQPQPYQQQPQPYQQQPQPYRQQHYPQQQQYPSRPQPAQPYPSSSSGTTKRSSTNTYPGRMPRGGQQQNNSISDHVVVWEPDHMRTICPLCSEEFGFFRRKHHCRECGTLVCDDCSSKRKQLQDYSGRVRVCDRCFSGRNIPVQPPVKKGQTNFNKEEKAALPGTGSHAPPLFSENKNNFDQVPSAPPDYYDDMEDNFQPGAQQNNLTHAPQQLPPSGPNSMNDMRAYNNNGPEGGGQPSFNDMNSYNNNGPVDSMSFEKQVEGK